MTYPFNNTVTILGTVYDIEVKNRKDDVFKGHSDAAGFTSWVDRKIIIKERVEDTNDIPDRDAKALITLMKKTLRHEIVHAFLNESGLFRNTSAVAHWSTNEEMVDWIAMQGPKLVAAWTEAGAL